MLLSPSATSGPGAAYTLGSTWVQPWCLVGVRVAQSLVLCVCVVDRCLSFCTLYLMAIVFSVLLWFADSDYLFGVFWPLCCLFFFDLRILITPLVFFDHCVVCSSIYGFWLHFWYLQTLLSMAKLKLSYNLVRISALVTNLR